MRPSMGSVGDCYDNALCESFFATLEVELLDRTTLKNHSQARLALFEFIEAWYNRRRRHQSLGYLSPERFEALHHRPHPAEARDERFRGTWGAGVLADSSELQTPSPLGTSENR